MSDYYRRRRDLEAQRCKTCYGSGKCNDADDGDIDYREWTCPQ